MSITQTRAGRILSSIAAICVLAGAALAGEPAAPPAPAAADISGRWQGESYVLASKAAEGCDGTRCTLTLDIARCASGWCGVEVAENQKCGATALRIQGEDDGAGGTVFKGKLELARGTEPYVVQAYLSPAMEGENKPGLEIIGDTGGEFRIFRRSFPFNARLVRAGDAKCKPETSISLLD